MAPLYVSLLVEHVEHMEHAGYDRGRRAPAGLRPPGTRLAPRPTAVRSSKRAAAMRPAFASPPPPRPRLRATSHPLTPSAFAPNHRNGSLFTGPATAPPPATSAAGAAPTPTPPPPPRCLSFVLELTPQAGAHASRARRRAGEEGKEPRPSDRRRALCYGSRPQAGGRDKGGTCDPSDSGDDLTAVGCAPAARPEGARRPRSASM